MIRLVFFLLLTVPLISFAVANSHIVVIHFPLVEFVIFVPLYALFFVLMIAGVVLASLVQLPLLVKLKHRIRKLEKSETAKKKEEEGEAIKVSRRRLLKTS